MSTVTPTREVGAASHLTAHPGEQPPGVLATVREAMERPLAPYYVLLFSTGLLLITGLIMVSSASSVYSFRYYDDSYAVVRKQVVWVVLGLAVAWIASRMNVTTIRRLAWPAMAVSIFLLLLTQTPLGVEVNGNKNWLGIGPLQIQPSEIAKLALILWAADVYANKKRSLHRLHDMLIPVVPGMFVAIGLVLLQRDLGTALVVTAIGMAVLWVVGAPGKLYVLALSIVCVGALFFATTSPERKGRLSNFLDPFNDLHGTGWQPAHGLYALSSGGWFGQGLGASRQKWGTLPEAHTDFIFAVLGEELGLIGALFVLGLFVAMAWACIRVALATNDVFIRIVTAGVVAWLMGQMIINVGMVLTLLPVIGLPLPLVSYGGSALVPSMVALGLVLGFARREPEAAKALAARERMRPKALLAQGRSTVRAVQNTRLGKSARAQASSGRRPKVRGGR